MAIKLKSEKRLKQVDTSSENANTYEAGDIVYDSNGNKFRTTTDAANWSDLTVPATVTDISSIGNVGTLGSTNRGKVLKVADGSDAIEYKEVDEAIAALFTITADGSNHFRFAGPGFVGTENDPTLYLIRGRKYRFTNNAGTSPAHPFQFQTNSNGTVGTGGQIYQNGITFASGTDIDHGETATWEVRNDAPATLYYQCTAHTAMGGVIKIVDGSGSVRTVEVDTNGDNSVNNTLDPAEALRFKKGGGITLAESGGIIEIGASPTNLNPVANGTSLTIESSTGTNASLPAATTSAWGVMTDEDKTKLDGGILVPTPGGGGDANKFVKINGSGNGLVFQTVDISPGLMYHDVTISGSNVNIESNLNAGDGGTVMVTDTSQNAAGTNAGKGVTVDTSNLTKTAKKSRYEIMSASPGDGFRFKADSTAITSFGGQATINAGVGDNNGLSVGDAQKVVLLYTGSAWKYMIQSI